MVSSGGALMAMRSRSQRQPASQGSFQWFIPILLAWGAGTVYYPLLTSDAITCSAAVVVMFVGRLQIALYQAAAARGRHIQHRIVEKPGGAQERDRHWQRLQCFREVLLCQHHEAPRGRGNCARHAPCVFLGITLRKGQA